MRTSTPRIVTATCLLLALVACSTDTPTAPERVPAPPAGSAPTTSWNITVSVDPGSLTASSDQPATVTVRIRRAADGAVPPSGTTAVVSAGLGEFNSSGSGEQDTVVTLSGGVAQLLYFAGAIFGTDTIRAQLEASVGSTGIEILEPEVLFIESVSPNVGPEQGGTRIRITGTGFTEPARVTLGDGAKAINATVEAVGSDSQGGFIRAITGPVFDDEIFFDTESCDSDGDGITDGLRFLSTIVDVTVTLTGGSAVLTNAFTYIPDDRDCRKTSPDPDRPSANFTFITNGLDVQFFNESSPPAGLTFTWRFGDGSSFSTAENPLHTYACPTVDQPVPPCSYDVTLRVENASGSATSTKAVSVSP